MSVKSDMQRFLTMCLEVTSEHDREALLSRILDSAMDCAHSDAGTLYLLEDDGLHFCRMVTRSMGVRQGGHDAPITLPPVPLEPKYVAAWVALNNKPINVADVHTDTHFDFTGSIRYDAMTGYRTQSMLVVPMSNDKGELIGVTQLINAQGKTGETIPFDPSVELLVSALSSLSAISITNMRYAEQITKMLDSIVGTLSTAIDERSHYNANHTRNMVRVGENYLNWLERTGSPRAFDAIKRRAFLMSVWLHDVGKLAVPLTVMDKNSRLGPAIDDIRARFRVVALLNRIEVLEGRIDEAELARRTKENDDALAFIEYINKSGYLPDDKLAQVDELAKRTYVDENGETQPLLTEDEHVCLQIRKGTLTDDERKVMQSHVVVTGRILNSMVFPKIYSQVPKWASAHHELLNGAGYPDHLKGESIPDEVRLLTILDIFDALTAHDRPYKPPMSLEKALQILHEMAEKEGSLDGELLAEFERSKAWEGVI